MAMHETALQEHILSHLKERENSKPDQAAMQAELQRKEVSTKLELISCSLHYETKTNLQMLRGRNFSRKLSLKIVFFYSGGTFQITLRTMKAYSISCSIRYEMLSLRSVQYRVLQSLSDSVDT